MDTNNLINKGRTKRWVKAGLFIMVAMALVQACATSRIPEGARIIEDTPTKSIPTKTPYVTPTVPGGEVLTATAAALQAHDGAVRFMSYGLPDGGLGKLPEIITVLKAYNADVLAIHEANGWLANDFAVAEQVAGELGMNYVFCQADPAAVDKGGNTYDLVIFSKLEIKNSESFPDVSYCLLRAEVAIAGGQSVQFFATQINPNFDDVGCQNVENIAKAMEPYISGQAILMGDMTMPPPGVVMGYPESQIACPPVFEAAGLTFFTDVSQVDHVWASEGMLANQSYKLPNPNKEPLVSKVFIRNISDHYPLAVDFYFP